MSKPEIEPTAEALQQEMQAMARTVYERHRHRLGQLTSEQESAIKALLQSTVNRISHPITYCLRRSREGDEAGDMQSQKQFLQGRIT